MKPGTQFRFTAEMFEGPNREGEYLEDCACRVAADIANATLEVALKDAQTHEATNWTVSQFEEIQSLRTQLSDAQSVLQFYAEDFNWKPENLDHGKLAKTWLKKWADNA